MRPKSFTPAEIRELIKRLRIAAKDTEIRGRWEGMAHHTLGGGADALEYLLQYIEWRPIETAPHGKKLLCRFVSESGHARTILAEYIGTHTAEVEDEDFGDEFDDGYFLPEGWYECIWTDDRGGSRINPTHWRGLPPPPQDQKQGSDRAQKEKTG